MKYWTQSVILTILSGSTLYTQVTLEQLHEGLATISATAEQISSWAKTNRFRLNADKTKAIIFGSSHLLKLMKALNLTGVSIVGEVIPFSDDVVSLGLVLQSK